MIVTTEFILLTLFAYLLGSVPAAYLLAKWFRGIDIREYGSGNVGASNLWKVISKRSAITASIYDLAKGIAMVWAAKLLGLDITQQVTVGVAAVVGHNWPVFLRFSGGRGVLTTLGIALVLPLINGLVPWGIIVFLAIAGASFFAIHNIPIGVGIGIAALPLVNWLSGEPTPITLGFLAMFLIMVIRRLTAPRTSFAAAVPTRQLLINRLLFDRDIRDREAWIQQRPQNPASRTGKMEGNRN